MLRACDCIRRMLFWHSRPQQLQSRQSVRTIHCCAAPKSNVYSQDRVLADGTFVPAGSLPLRTGQSVDKKQLISKEPLPATQTKTHGKTERPYARPATSWSLEETSTSGRESSSSAQPSRSPGVPPTAPSVPPVTTAQLEELVDFMQSHRNVAVLTGAGCSTESNIPDYRGPSGAYSTGFKPMTHQQFTSSEQSRARYWARSFAGWHEYCDVAPNAAHWALARLQRTGRLSDIITQNVDRLHQKAGTRDVLELHGTTHEVMCLKCGNLTDRGDFQQILAAANPDAAAAVQQMRKAGKDDRGAAARMARIGSDERASVAAKAGAAVRRPDGDVEWPVRRPDGDVELRDAGHGFYVPPCTECGGALKPDVVFFGDGVPKWRAQRALEITGEVCDAMLVVGSSLQVYSAYRLARACTNRGAPLALLNAGSTRSDDAATLKIPGLAGEVLARLAAHPAMQIPPI